jgi:hypothetical protein
MKFLSEVFLSPIRCICIYFIAKNHAAITLPSFAIPSLSYVSSRHAQFLPQFCSTKPNTVAPGRLLLACLRQSQTHALACPFPFHRISPCAVG